MEENSRMYTDMLKTRKVRDEGGGEISHGILVTMAVLEMMTVMCFECLLCKHCAAYLNI